MRSTLKTVMLTGLVVALAVAANAVAKKPHGGNQPCHPEIVCPMVWDPVICDDGNTYSNACVAHVWCATGCVPAGGGPVPLIEE